jgi:hypothetical protein
MFRKLIIIAAVMLMLIVPASALDGYQGIDTSYANIYNFTPDFTMSNGTSDNYCKGIGLRTMQSSWEFAVTTNATTEGFMNPFGSIPILVTYSGQQTYPTTTLTHITSATLCGPCYGDDTSPGCWYKRYYDQYGYRTGYGQPTTDIFFSVSETGNFTKKLSGAIVTLSNGQSNTTGTDGTALIQVYPKSPSYTYGVTKSGYMNLAGVALGGYGETGGTVYTNMDPAVGSSKMVNLVAMQGGTDNYINGFTANVKDGSDNHWTNGTYPGGVAEIWTNKSTTLTGYVSATGYDSVTQTFTTDNTDWAEDWVVLMYPPTAANATVSNLRINVADYSTKLPLKGVNALLTSTGELGLTSTSGVASFTVPNGTSQQVIFSKSGYKPVTQSFTITTLISEWSIEMVEQTVTTVPPTPVHTYPNGSVIPDTPTVTPSLTGAALTAYNQAQDQAMMQQLRDAGPGIIGLCVVVILMRLIKMI